MSCNLVGRCTSLCRSNSPTLATEHPHAFKEDVVERAKHYAAGLTGGVGAYTNSQGIPAVREVHLTCTSVASNNMWQHGGSIFHLFCVKRWRLSTLS